MTFKVGDRVVLIGHEMFGSILHRGTIIGINLWNTGILTVKEDTHGTNNWLTSATIPEKVFDSKLYKALK